MTTYTIPITGIKWNVIMKINGFDYTWKWKKSYEKNTATFKSSGECCFSNELFLEYPQNSVT